MRNLPTLRLALVVTGAAIVATVLAFVPRPVTSADFAAWAQGLGTVLAVSVGVWASLGPARRQARERTQAKLDFTLDLIETLDFGAPAVRRLETAVAGGQVNATRVALKALEASGFQNDLAQLLEAPRIFWPDHATRGQARLLNRLLLHLRADQLPLDMPSATVQAVWIKHVEDQLQLITGMIVTLSQATGRPVDPPWTGGVARRKGVAPP